LKYADTLEIAEGVRPPAGRSLFGFIPVITTSLIRISLRDANPSPHTSHFGKSGDWSSEANNFHENYTMGHFAF